MEGDSKFFKDDKRLASVDILKVASIFAVVFIHSSLLIKFYPSNLDFSIHNISLLSTAFRFCVPVFIFLWAYFQEKSVIKHGNKIVIMRFYKLLIPFGVWSMIYFLVTANHIKDVGAIRIFTKYWFGYGWSGQYYFIILFQLLLLFPLIRRAALFIKDFVPAIYLFSFLFYGIIAYFSLNSIDIIGKISDRLFIYWLPYAILGVIYAHKNIFRFSFPLIIGIISIILIPLEHHFFHPGDLSPYLLPSIFFTTMVLCSFMESKLSHQAFSPWISKWVQLIANSTLGIFCLNPLVIITLHPFFRSLEFLQFPGCSILIPILSTLFVISTCMLIILLLKRLKFGFLVSN